MRVGYRIILPDTAKARASAEFPLASQGAEGIAGELQAALRGDALFERWRTQQDDPDAVDPALAGTDPDAVVTGAQHDLHVELLATTSLPGAIFKHRMRLLAGSAWELRDVSAA